MKTGINKHLIFFVSAILVFWLASGCEGPAGPDGTQGIQGPVGPAGENGSMMHAGDGAPDENMGAIGDYYLDKSTAELYGPKTEADGWGSPLKLAGKDGKDGSQIYAGTTDPDPSLGDVGDYYLNTATYDLYGPKTDNDWGTPINLQGNANVMSTDWIPIDFPDTAVTGANFDINDPNIDEEVLNSAAVLSYARVSSTTVIDIPFTYQNRSYYTVLFSSINVIRFRAVAVDGITAQIFNDFQEVRYVIIPASNVPGSTNKSKQVLLNELEHKGVDVTDFYSVAAYYGLSH